MKYTVIEVQNGVIGGNSWVYGENQYLTAVSKYYSVLAVAATSNVAHHAVLLINETGMVIKYDWFDHTIISNS